MGLDPEKKNIFVAECKWHDHINANKILNKLEEKIEHIPYEPAQIQYAIFAKSFKQRSNQAMCYDLQDLEKIFFE